MPIVPSLLVLAGIKNRSSSCARELDAPSSFLKVLEGRTGTIGQSNRVDETQCAWAS